MKLLLKFSLLFVLVFGAGMFVVGKLCYSFLQQSARDQVIQQAQLMMEAATAMRSYTTKQIKPLVGAPKPGDAFVPQTVPAYAATESFNYLRAKYPAYTYKEATLNPTNLRDRAVDWEADIVNVFRNDLKVKDFTGERDMPTGRSLYFARPISVGEPCLECHSTVDAAPSAMVKLYGTSNGYGWKRDEIVAAQIVSVPMSVPLQMADTAFTRLMTSIGAIALLTLVLLNLVLVFTVIRPVSRFAANADEISKGNLHVPELPVSGNDEIAVLAESFNRMHRSLIRAMKMLER